MKSLSIRLLVAITAGLLSTSLRADENLAIDFQWTEAANSNGLGQATGIGVDSHNHVFVFHRANRTWGETMPTNPIDQNTVVMLDASTGKPLAEWGADRFIMPHGLSVDADDNIWVTDVFGHTVQKFSHDGAHLLTLGVEGQAGDDSGHFNLPADVDFSASGEIYIADGYANTRVIKFTAKGDYIAEWGSPGDEAGQFNLPHGIAVSGDGKVYVADRANSRLQIFTETGEFLALVDRALVGRPYGVALGPEGTVWIIDGGDQPSKTRARVVKLSPELVPKSTFDTNYNAVDSPLGHDIAVSLSGEIYVVDAWANRVLKLKQK